MDIDALVSSIQGELKVLPLNQLASGEELAANLVPVVPWNWVLIALVSLFERYPSGLTLPVILSELQQAWDAVYGTTWSMQFKEVVATQICEILDHGRVEPGVALECEIKRVDKLEGSKETWVAQLVDTETSEFETRTLNWLLHQKYLPLMPNSGDTLKRTSSRGLMHTYNRAKAIQTYKGPILFQSGRKLRIGSPRLRKQWNHPTGNLSLLPSEDTIILLQNHQEAESWQDYNPEILKSSSKSADSRFSFKAFALLVPSWNSEYASSSPYLQPEPSISNESRTADIILGSQDFRPLAALRLSSQHCAMLSTIHEGDILCLHNCFLLFESRELVSGRIKNNDFTSDASHEPARLQLPIFSYESGTLAMILPKKLVDASTMVDTSTLSESTFETIPQTNDCRFHGLKVSPVLLQPNCSRVTMVGYVVTVFPRQKPKNGSRRHGIRLQDTQSSATCEITVWESSNSQKSILHSIRSGHLILIQGMWTVSSRDSSVVRANITDDSSKIINLSKMEGFVTSYSDIVAICHPKALILSSESNRDTIYPCSRFGPFIILKCQIQTSTMTLPTSLYHNMCGRSVGQPPNQSASSTTPSSSRANITCKFCNHTILDWNNECNWAFDVDWNLEIENPEGPQKFTTVVVRACSDVTSKLLKVSPNEFVNLSPQEKDLIAMYPATQPISGKACISRSMRLEWFLDQFVTNN
jgi:hypothetical protein